MNGSWFQHWSNSCRRTIQSGSFKVLSLVLVTFCLLWNFSPLQYLSEDPPQQKQSQVCLGRQSYKKWIDALFALAPPPPNCSDVEAFITNYKQGSADFVYGTIVLQRNEYSTNITKQGDESAASYYNDAFDIMDSEQKNPSTGGRSPFYIKIWRDANRHRTLPPNLEMVLYTNDKPRVRPDLNRLPVFVLAGHFPAGSGAPTEWWGYVPFPTHFYDIVPNGKLPNPKKFATKRPVVYYRGQFSEMAWTRYNRSLEFSSTPRFKLANATKYLSDRDVLDISITGIAAVHGEQVDFIRADLQRKFNITMGKYVRANDGNAMMSLSVPGNGWPGATTMRGLLSDTAMLMVMDNTLDNEGQSRENGEIYFPLLTPGVNYIPVKYETIATTARELLKNDTETLYGINVAAAEFAQSYLGYQCALDIVELLAWRYYEYVRSGCSTAFAHVQV
jgi:hypothetical protein